MKTTLYFLLFAFVLLSACQSGEVENTLQAPNPYADSIRCVQNWQRFQIPRDTILTLRYQQPVQLINGADTMRITVSRINDFCTVESEQYTYGCEARVWIDLSLNGQCTYKTKFGLTIIRRNARPVYTDTSILKCSWYAKDLLYDGPADNVLGFYNSLLLVNQLTPFAKDDKEFIDLVTNKQKYSVTVWLKKRCF